MRYHVDNDLSSYIVGNRVHAHAAAALINFCEGVERDTLIPYLDPIVERLLKLPNPAGLSSTNADAHGAGNENGTGVRRYVQEQVLMTLAMVADASEDTFAKVSFSLSLCVGGGSCGLESWCWRCPRLNWAGVDDVTPWWIVVEIALFEHHAFVPECPQEREWTGV